MPRIPTRGVSVALNVPGDRVSRAIGQAGATIDRGLARIQQAQDAFDRAQRVSTLTRLTTDLDSASFELESQFSEDTDFATSEDRFTAAFGEMAGGILAETDDPAIQEALEARIERARQSGLLKVRARAREGLIDKGVANLNERLRTGQRRIAFATNDVERQAAIGDVRNDLSLAREAGFIKAVQEDEALATVLRGSDLDAVRDVIEKSPGMALEILKETESLPNLTPEDFDDLREEAQAAVDALQAGANIKAASNLAIAVSRAKTSADVELLRGAVEDAFNDGLITGPKRTEHVKALDKVMAGAIQREEDLARFSLAMAGAPIDPKDPDAKRSIETGLEALTALDPARSEEIEQEVVTTTGIVPESTAARMRAVANSSQFGLIEQEAERFANYRNEAPQIESQIPSEAKNVLENVMLDREIGISAQESVTRSRELMKVDKATEDARERLYDQIQQEQPDGEWLQEQDGITNIPRSLRLDLTVEIPGTWKARFAQEVRRQYLIEPNINKARSRAYRDITRTLGQTGVGDLPTLMVEPPEKAYPEFGGDREAITEQLRADVFGAMGPVRFEQSAQHGIAITSDFATPREVDAEGRVRPGYPIYFLDENGEVGEPFIDRGVPQRFYPNFATSPAGRELAERTEKAKKEQKRRALLPSVAEEAARAEGF